MINKIYSPTESEQSCLEYIWIDGSGKLRSKTKLLKLPASLTQISPVLTSGLASILSYIPEWGFDGSSTGQATSSTSDVILKPVFVCRDPIRGYGNFLVLCETFNADGSPNKTNHRRALVNLLETEISNGKSIEDKYKPLFGLEQEYVLLKGGRPLGWPESGYPAPQGPFYCGVGADEVFGREIIEEHLMSCMEASLPITGINAEVMPGQWEFQVGTAGPLEVSDSLWVARWLLYRVSEKYGISATLDPKPVRGDWNGSGCHANFSTIQMRDGDDNDSGLIHIFRACDRIGRRVSEHLAVYGKDNEQRLTGKHETCNIKEFRYGIADRGASIRIPLHVSKQGSGYLEDRRPAANIDPYQVTAILLKTIAED